MRPFACKPIIREKIHFPYKIHRISATLYLGVGLRITSRTGDQTLFFLPLLYFGEVAGIMCIILKVIFFDYFSKNFGLRSLRSIKNVFQSYFCSIFTVFMGSMFSIFSIFMTSYAVFLLYLWHLYAVFFIFMAFLCSIFYIYGIYMQ